MKKYKKLFLGIAIVGAVVAGIIFLFTAKPKTKALTPLPPAGTYEYFWGDGCPHCANVQAFLDSWDKKDKLNLDKKEVWNSIINQALMRERADYCKLDTSQGMGVPLLFTPEGKCLMGDTPIIDYFKSLQL